MDTEMELINNKKLAPLAAVVALLAIGIAVFAGVHSLASHGPSGTGLPAGAKDLGPYKPPVPHVNTRNSSQMEYPQESH